MSNDEKLSELTTDNNLEAGTRLYTVNGTTSGYSEYDQLCEKIAFDGLLSAGWEDLRVPMTATKGAGVRDPSFVQFKDNGAGSTGVFVYGYGAGVEEELFFSVQMPHSWKVGTIIKPHVHWAPNINGGAGHKVNWGLEYHWSNEFEIFGNTTIISANIPTPNDATLVANKHYVTELGDIDGSGITISSMLNCRLFRDGGGAIAPDGYLGDGMMFEFDFHYQVDKFGTEETHLPT